MKANAPPTVFSTDLFYGHTSVLAWFCGLHVPRPVLAHLQHGWNPRMGFGKKDLYHRGGLTQALPKLVWNSHNARLATEYGLRRVHAIGAPFLYLLELLDGGGRWSEPPIADTSRRGVLVYPHHHGASGGGVRSIDRYIEQLLEREGAEARVCLYWRDFHDVDLRSQYEHAGFEVICHGSRTDPLFLVRQREEILKHARVVTNRVATALWYAALLGSEVEVYGPLSDSRSVGWAEHFDKLQRDRWPFLFAGSTGGRTAWEAAHGELGVEHRRTRLELLELLGWSGWRNAVARPLSFGRSVQHRLAPQLRLTSKALVRSGSHP